MISEFQNTLGYQDSFSKFFLCLKKSSINLVSWNASFQFENPKSIVLGRDIINEYSHFPPLVEDELCSTPLNIKYNTIENMTFFLDDDLFFVGLSRDLSIFEYNVKAKKNGALRKINDSLVKKNVKN